MVHYRIHHIPQTVSILSQINLVHAPLGYFFKKHFNIVLSFTPISSKWAFYFMFPTKTLYALLIASINLW